MCSNTFTVSFRYTEPVSSLNRLVSDILDNKLVMECYHIFLGNRFSHLRWLIKVPCSIHLSTRSSLDYFYAESYSLNIFNFRNAKIHDFDYTTSSPQMIKFMITLLEIKSLVCKSEMIWKLKRSWTLVNPSTCDVEYFMFLASILPYHFQFKKYSLSKAW